MQTHVLTVAHSGLLADYGVMDAVLGEHVQRAARRLLAANAYYYTRGYVPARLRSRTRDFQIVERAPENGSLTRELLVAIAGSAIYDAAKVSFSEFAITAVALSGLSLLSIKRERWIELGNKIKQLIREDQPVRIEPTLPFPSYPPTNHVDVTTRLDQARSVAQHVPREAAERDVVRVTTEAIEQLSEPMETAAAHKLALYLDDELLLSITLPSAPSPTPKHLDAEIAAAVQRLRARSR